MLTTWLKCWYLLPICSHAVDRKRRSHKMNVLVVKQYKEPCKAAGAPVTRRMAGSSCPPCPMGHTEKEDLADKAAELWFSLLNGAIQTLPRLQKGFLLFLSISFCKDLSKYLGLFEQEVLELLLIWVCKTAIYLGEGILSLRVSLDNCNLWRVDNTTAFSNCVS